MWLLIYFNHHLKMILLNSLSLHLILPLHWNPESVNISLAAGHKMSSTLLTLKSLVSVCAPEVSNFHITLLQTDCWTSIGPQAICDVTSHSCECAPSKGIFNKSRKLFHFQQINAKNILWVSNSAHRSFCTVKLKHSTVGTKQEEKLFLCLL